MNWASAEVLAALDKIIMEEGFGCEARIVPGDTVPTFTSMAEKAQPDVAPEFWASQFRDQLDKAVDEGRIVVGASSLSDGGEEGWWIPEYFAKEHPEIQSVSDALAHPELFPAPEDPSKGAVYGCPSGWACQITTSQLFKATKAADKGFVLVDTGSAAGLDGSITKAYENKKPWLGYYWAPTAILGKYPMKKLEIKGEFDQKTWDSCNSVIDCPDPKVMPWPKSPVVTIMTPSLSEAPKAVQDYFNNRAWDNATVNQLLAWKEDNQATGEDAAYYFLENNPDVWTKWVSKDVAEKVKNAL
ncbi:glycine betaine/proline transport system substrate-binding protein [Consotaella salsifontis]|uniref:Glycine betaine/proline transport system substrate-binding protein n=2 Tax=Consotaella salsifontis TaxID=1365950 RepID=A0A1T4QU32_9HYPH|nr:glycine betaine/proline transport system substrate-binding protein [Consotaella salsifontis]